jgi:hypothetical protein
MSKYVIYLQTVNIVPLVNSNKTAIFPENNKLDFIHFPRPIYIQTAFNIMEFWQSIQSIVIYIFT